MNGEPVRGSRATRTERAATAAERATKRERIVSNARMYGTGWQPKMTLARGIAELIKGLTILNNSKYGNV